MNNRQDNIAVWALTPGGAVLGERIVRRWPGNADLYLSRRLSKDRSGCKTFERLADTLASDFNTYGGHVFIMATGIVVRLTAPLLQHKTLDPAVVVVDEKGRYAVSLISGHVGGANRLAEQLAALTGAAPVITTATDVNELPAVDFLAVENDLVIENPWAIKVVNMAVLEGRKIRLHDPYRILQHQLPKAKVVAFGFPAAAGIPGIFIDDTKPWPPLPDEVLVLRPKSLVAGMGCNRGTSAAELLDLLLKTLDRFGLAVKSLQTLATVDIKKDEPGLTALAAGLGISIRYFDKQELNSVQNVPRPSAAVEKHIGVRSVCEAAAILASRNGNLIVCKQKTPNATLAIARVDFTS